MASVTGQDRAWLFRALQLFAAAGIALTVAVQLGLHNAFWAAMPVWVVAQPYRQDLLLRAILRIAGTLLGALVGWLVLVHVPSHAVWIAVLVLGVGLAGAAAYWIGTIYSYGVLLAAITLAVVLIPALDHPIDATALAADRVWCTLIGTVSVTVITFLFTPTRTDSHPLRLHPPAGVTLRHGVIIGVTTLLGALALLAIGGPAGIATAMALTIFSLIIGTSRNPAPILKYMPLGGAIGVAAAIAYRALDMALPDPEGMALLLALAFIAAGALVRAHPRLAPFGLDANMCFLLSAEAGTAGHGLSAHVQGGVALVISAFLFAAVFTRIGAKPQS